LSALSQIIEIEHKINDYLKSVDAATAKLRKTQLEIERSSKSLEELGVKVTYHTNNLKHMKSKADIVNLEEYSKTKQHLRAAIDSVSEAQADRRKAVSDEAFLVAQIGRYSKEIEEARTQLSAYGRLVFLKRDP
jgi:chromosome segregation ATPase